MQNFTLKALLYIPTLYITVEFLLTSDGQAGVSLLLGCALALCTPVTIRTAANKVCIQRVLQSQKRAREEVEDKIIREWAKQERKAVQEERERREQRQSWWRRLLCFD